MLRNPLQVKPNSEIMYSATQSSGQPHKAATALGISAGASNTRFYLIGLGGLLLAALAFHFLRSARS